jgi:hypothetical protein
MKYIIITGMIVLLITSCGFKQDDAARLVKHMQQMERIFAKNQDNPETLAAELSAYSMAHMEEMQKGVKNITERLKKIDDNPMDSFDLLSKVTQISSIIVSIKNNYGQLIEDPAVSESFKKYGAIFSAIQNLGSE